MHLVILVMLTAFYYYSSVSGLKYYGQLKVSLSCFVVYKHFLYAVCQFQSGEIMLLQRKAKTQYGKCSQLSHGLARLQVIHVACISCSATVNTTLLPPGLAQSESTTASCIQCVWPEVIHILSFFSWLCAGKAQTCVVPAALGNTVWRYWSYELRLCASSAKPEQSSKKSKSTKCCCTALANPLGVLSAQVQCCRTTASQSQFIIVPRLTNSCKI